MACTQGCKKLKFTVDERKITTIKYTTENDNTLVETTTTAFTSNGDRVVTYESVGYKHLNQYGYSEDPANPKKQITTTVHPDNKHDAITEGKLHPPP